jgi:hypothetical protein
MPDPKATPARKPRGAYARLICLGCRERRIRCELPSDIDIPEPGELRTVQTPCYRCKRLGVPCIVRQTILGRPSTAASESQPEHVVSRIVIELPSRPAARFQRGTTLDDESRVITLPGLSSRAPPHQMHRKPPVLLTHTPSSPSHLFTIRAMDSLHTEHVQKEWFRHLPSHIGHLRALDLSVAALVAACAYRRRVPLLTPTSCFHALSLALDAVQTTISNPKNAGAVSDEILAATAMLAHFEGAIRAHGIPVRVHMDGLAAILGARKKGYRVTSLAREIVDFHACDAAVKASIAGRASVFENVAREYYASEREGREDGSRAKLRAIGVEMFMRVPRAVGLVRRLRQGEGRTRMLGEARGLVEELLGLKDEEAEHRVLRDVEVRDSAKGDAVVKQSWGFTCVEDFEALAYYWQNRLVLLRLEEQLDHLPALGADPSDELAICCRPRYGPSTNEMFTLVKNILMCAEYVSALWLRKHDRLYAHGMVAVWGVTRNMPGAVSDVQSGDADIFWERSLRILNVVLRAKPDLAAEDIDIAADIFVGGPPEGKYVELYGL